MTWSPDPDAFLRDLEAKPAALRSLAPRLEADPWREVGRTDRIVLIGMGSSRFAALPAAAMLRAGGRDVVVERASAAPVAAAPAGPGTLAVALSASGTTPETVAALARHRDGGSTTVAITNVDGSPLAEIAGHHISLGAGEETGGVACRSFQHTIAVLLAMLDAPHAAAATRRAADASEDLLDRRASWLPRATDVVDGAGPMFVLAPDERISSAEQGALMFREGPRTIADACETGDWLHVDVYLTKPLDYRAVRFSGSRFDDDVARWIDERGGRLLSVGATAGGVRYRGDDESDVALLSETLVAELVAADVWRRQA